jgi:general secretion pathway protein C
MISPDSASDRKFQLSLEGHGMAVDQVLRKNFAIVILPMVAIAALLNAQAVSQLVGIGLMPDEKDLARPPAVAKIAPASTSTARSTSAEPILARNPFDHVTGPLHVPETADTSSSTSSASLDTSDPWNAPACDGVTVTTLAADPRDPDWSFAAVAGSDGKAQLRRRGGEVGGKKVHFIGWDRVWFDAGGSLCQVKVFEKGAVAAKPAAAEPAPAASSAAPSRGGPGKPLDPAIKQGIQKVSETEYNVDRGTLDKILENQADLMRQARVVPEQENGRTVGIRMMGIRDDSLLGVLGMKTGDRLQTINGFDMSSPEKALEAYARLRTADKLTVQINRGGKNMNLDYNIK